MATALGALLIGIFVLHASYLFVSQYQQLVVGLSPFEVSETSGVLGGALGVAVLGSVATAVYRAQLPESALIGVPPDAGAAAGETLGGAVAGAAALPHETAARLLDAAQAAFVDGMVVAAVLSAALMLGVAAAAAALLRRIDTAGS